MKKIIYSLVIMIAAGSLFTSCVTNTEPQGVKDLREAKADYLASLSKLREADAEKIKADAAYRQAEIAIVNAQAALAQATAEAAQIANEIQKARNEAEVEVLKAQIAATKANAELAAVNAEKALAFAKSDLEKALRKIAAESIGLTVDEKIVIERKVNALNAALDRYHTAFVNVERAKMDIWNMEYDLAAGAEEIDIANQTIDALADYEAMIADAEDIIASDSTEIAVLTESLEVPEKIAGFLAAYEDSVKQLRVDSLLVLQNLRFYEQSVWPDANQAYIDAWNKFYTDSVPAGGSSNFSKEYPLINGKSLDKQFKDFIDYYNLTTFNNFPADGKKFKVSGTITAVSSQLSDVKAIVAALNRELVILDNLKDSLSIEEQKVKAFKADSTYKADRAILEKGLAEWGPYKDSVKKIEPLQKKLDSTREAYKAAAAKIAADTLAVLENAKILAEDYDLAMQAFDVQMSRFVAPGTDTARFLGAIRALGMAQAAYLNRQDTVAIDVPVTIQGVTKTFANIKVAFEDLDIAAFRNNPSTFVNKIQVASNWTAGTTAIVDSVAAVVGGIRVGFVYDGKDYVYIPDPKTNKQDTVKWITTKLGFAKEVFKADSTALANAATDTANARTAFDNYQGVKQAKQAYIDIYKKFWHINDIPWTVGTETIDTADVLKAQIFAWNENTFTKPELCVSFRAAGDSIVPNKALFVALDGLAGKDTAFVSKTKDVNNHAHCNIFFGEEYTNTPLQASAAPRDCRTEYADALYQAQVLEDMGDYNSRKSQLENINTQIAAVETDLNAAIADFNTANAARTAVLARLTGGGAQVDTLNSSYVKLTDGTWNLKGYQKAWADEFAPEYPKLIAEANKQQTTIANKIQRAEDFLKLLEDSYVQYRNFVDNESDQSLDAMITRIEAEIAGDLADIDYNKQLIVIYTKAIAEIEQGYDTNSIKLKTLKDKLEKAQTLLAQAEEQLKIAQAEYDEVMAAYGVKNAAE